MARIPLSDDIFDAILDAAQTHALDVEKVNATTIAITRDSMVALFPDTEEGYYDETLKILLKVTPDIAWKTSGKTDRVGFYEAYRK